MNEILIIRGMYPSVDKPWLGTYNLLELKGLKENNVKYDFIYFKFGAKWRYFIFPLFFLINYRSRYKIVHVEHSFLVISLSIFKYILGFKIIYSCHEGELLSNNRVKKIRDIVFIKKLAGHIADAIIIVNKNMTKPFPKSKLHYISYGIDLNQFYEMGKDKVRELIGLKSSSHYILFLADPNRSEKRVDRAHDIIQYLKEKGIQNIELLVVHQEPYSNIPIYINACDVLLLTSDYEASPTVIKEAMACNCPIVATDVGDIKELFSEVINCFVSEYELEKFANKILEIANKNEKSNGRDIIIKKDLSYQSSVLKTINLYKSLNNH
jgi:glycosyltransferase involved in cell wall biosynthesis